MKQYKTMLPRITLKHTKTDFPKARILSSQDSYNFIRQFYGDDIVLYESVFLLLLNRNNGTIGYVKISQGGVAGTVVDKLLVAKYAVESMSQAVILCHNHPSGNTRPSEQDKTLTRGVVEALKLFDIKTLDHLIITEDSYFSFTDEGLL
jgi:DNA repair protein RadC